MNESTTSLSSLRQDSHNANRGTERGLEMIRASLERLGAGRSLVLDREGRIVAGNQTARAAALAGMDEVIVVKTDGRRIVAVQRTDLDLDSPEGRELALVDNRAGEVGLEWSADVLAELQGDGLDLSGLFTDGEIEALLQDLNLGDSGIGDLEESGDLETGAEGPGPESPGPGWPPQGGAGGSGTVGWDPTLVGGTGQARQAPGSEEGPLPDGIRQSAAPPPTPDSGRPLPASRPLGPQGAPGTPPASPASDFIAGQGAPPVRFKEFDESVAAGLAVRQCPACGNRWAE